MGHLAAQLFPEGYDIAEENSVLSGTAQMNSATISVIGTTNHTEIGVEIALKQAQLVLMTMRDYPERPILLLVDTTGSVCAAGMKCWEYNDIWRIWENV
jgi:malonate decarboxylase gamma subunit